ncbi:protein ALP1-like [Papaver somniferum]|uniref:protein ALP1-like n=1 Tax=Papaver somniferum TaxID=3469 RepID=UPI000E70127C|nr:protein ALP1-like [Papaver somniferum]
MDAATLFYIYFYSYVLHHQSSVLRANDRFELTMRSGDTISRHVNTVLKGVIRLQGELLKEPVAVSTSSVEQRWNCFKNCLGALYGTHISVHVATADKPRYRTRKNAIATNVLGVCSQDLEVIYVYPGWEGSAADSRVLREAFYKKNGLKVPHGYYYLVDAGYPNSGGFLAPFRGQRYHLKEWGRDRLEPRTAEELFNMKHCRVRNVIERVFGLLKMRWAIFRGPSWYPVNIHCRFIMACCLIHNLIRREMPMDEFLPEDEYEDGPINLVSPQESRIIEHVDSSNYWDVQRKELADQMWERWTARRCRRIFS